MSTQLAHKVSRREHTRTILASLAVGVVIAILWSFALVDNVIGDSVANGILGYDAKETPIAGVVMGVFFAFASGFAGTFTACNICVFSAIAPLAAEKRSFASMVRPIAWMGVGLLAVTATYGAIGTMLGSRLPQLSDAVVGASNYPLRLLQSTVVFTTIGLVFILWGLMTLNIIPNPGARISHRYPQARLLLMGTLIGGFLIGRPFPLFRKMFEYAASVKNPLYGSLTFAIQGLANILIMLGLFLLLTYGTGGRFERWLTASPNRGRQLTAVALLIGGAFFVAYWGLRVPAHFGIGWWPTMPWN